MCGSNFYESDVTSLRLTTIEGCENGIKQADYLLLYEQNWLKEGTEALVLKKTAESSK